ncbi:MAG: hypothetical protein QOH13_384 [Thermoleophilaceae bacterium]|nr:hypothetical protein [Thermoleophilaceae bacterium]
MKVFLLDLWLDLKEKRLAPVALALLLGVIAVPIVLAKGSASPPPPPPTATTAAAPATPVIGAPDQAQVDSKLQVFSPRDPFEPTGSSSSAASTTSSTTTATSGGTSTSTTTTTTGSGTTGSGTTPGGATTGTQPTTGTGNTGNTTPETKTTLFTYTADLKFGEAGSMTTFKAVKRLELIPSSSNPKIVFLGVTTTAKTAVFLVDSNIGVDTAEGTCRPSADECTFLYLRPDADHDQATLTDSDGTVYHLRLLAINRVTVSSSTGSGNSGSGNSNGNSNSNRSPAFTGTAKQKSNADTVPGETPPGEPDKPFTYQQFFADSSGN